MLDCSLFYYDKGLAIIPAVYGDKKPIVEWKKYQKERPTREQVINWFKGGDKNIAMIVGEVSGNIVVLDFEALEYYNDFFKEGLERSTWVVKSGGGGRHVYLICFEPIENRKITNKEGKLVLEIRAKDQIVILPPSLHPSGARYEFLSDPKEVDIAVVEGLEEKLRDKCESLGWQGFPKRLSVEQIARKPFVDVYKGKDPVCIRAMLKGVPHGFRDEAAVRLAQYFLTKGLSIEEAIERLVEWNERNSPPIGQLAEDPRDIERYFADKIKSAGKTGRFGCRSLKRVAGVCCGRDGCEFFQFKRKRRGEKWLITISR